MTKAVRASKRRKALCSMCIIVAMSAHLLFLVLLQDAQFDFPTSSHLPTAKKGMISDRSILEEEKQKNEILKEIFQEISVRDPISKPPEIPEFKPEINLLPADRMILPHPTAPLAEANSLSLLLEIDAPAVTFEAESADASHDFIPFKLDEKHPSLSNALMLATDQMTTRTKQQIPDYLLLAGYQYSDDEEMDPRAAIASSDDFDLDVKYAPRSDGQGYLVQMRFVPKADSHFKRIRQNYFFLLDRSYSINKSRFQLSKAAVIHALKFLKKGDTFNILVFDHEVYPLFAHNVHWDQHSVARAEQFLDFMDHGGKYAGTDIYSSLDKIIPVAVADQEVNTAILFTDGDSNLPKEEQRRGIEEWTRKNRGKVSLYCIASGKGNDIPLMQLLSVNNKGNVLYSPEHEQIGNSMVNLMHEVNRPIGKEIIATGIATDGRQGIFLYPRQRRLPDLHGKAGYVLYGWVPQRKTFHLFLQGKYYDRWLDIQKEVSFANAKQVDGAALEKQWAFHAALDHYDAFLSNGDNKQLNEAKQLLAPFKIPAAF